MEDQATAGLDLQMAEALARVSNTTGLQETQVRSAASLQEAQVRSDAGYTTCAS